MGATFFHSCTFASHLLKFYDDKQSSGFHSSPLMRTLPGLGFGRISRKKKSQNPKWNPTYDQEIHTSQAIPKAL